MTDIPPIVVHVTHHAYERVRERLGLKKAALDRLLPRIMEKGKRHGDLKGNLHNWISGKFRAHHATDMRVYGHHCFFFKGNCLITVLHVPPDLKKLV